MLSYHPLAELFPLMDDDTFARLVGDIRANGLREPIITHEGMILDGRNRYRACAEIGVEPITKPWDGRGTPLDFVVSKNLHRRHLSEGQRAAVGDKIANMKQGGDRGNQHTGGKLQICSLPEPEPNQPSTPPVSRAQAAKMMNVSERSIAYARAVREKGAPEVRQAVEAGTLGVSVAAEFCGRHPKDEQQEILKLLPGAKSIHKGNLWRAECVRSKGVDTLQQAVEAGKVSLNAAEYLARSSHEEQRTIMAQGAKAVAQLAWKMNKEKQGTRPTKSKRSNPSSSGRRETHQLKAEIWKQFRDALELLRGLPHPSEVASIVASFGGAPPIVDARLDQSLAWLEAFANEWRNRRENSSAA